MSDHKTQADRILSLLCGREGNWVPLPEIMSLAAQYNARIYGLRKAGYDIQNKTEKIDGIVHSWFRLVSHEPPQQQEPQREAV